MAKKKDTHDLMRCSSLRAVSVPESVERWYADLQDDYKRFLTLFLSWIAIGYCKHTDSGVEYVTPEEAREIRNRSIPGSLLPAVEQFIAMLTAGGNTASSCYNIFYEAYKSTGKAKLTEGKRKFINEKLVDMTEEEIVESTEHDPQLSKLSLDSWLTIQRRLQDGEEFEVIWGEISPAMASDVSAGVTIREALGSSCHRPQDASYCRILTEMVGRQFRSVVEKYKTHLKETEEKRSRLPTPENDDYPLFQLVCELADALKEKNYGLSRVVFTRGVREVLSPPKKPSNIQTAVDELKLPKYRMLVLAKPEVRNRVHRSWKLKRELDNRKIYPCLPNIENDYKVPIGQTGIGSFRLSVEDGRVTAQICNLGELGFERSHYFHSLQLTEIRKKKSLVGYLMKFRHKLKARRSNVVGPEIVGVLKEVGLRRKKNGKFYLTLPYTISHPLLNFEVANFFQKATPTAEQIYDLPDELRIAAVDLNISNPVCAVKARAVRNGSGPLNVLDYGRAEIIDGPRIIVGDGSRCQKLIKLKNEAVMVKDAIRELKSCQKTGTELSEETRESLLTISSPSPAIRCVIQTWVATLGRRLRDIKYDMRREGYQSLGEAIRLLDFMDTYESLLSSYERIHLKPGEQLPKKPKFDSTRANFRLHLSRRIAAAVAKFASDCNVLFIEDLDAEFDSDNDNNSLLRLFAAKTLIQCIKDAAEKIGVAVVEVAKNGTSRTDPVTGSLGWRDVKEKSKLYVVRDGQLGWIDADLAASLNVMIQGLNHSVCPYRFTVPKPQQKKKTSDGPKPKKEGYGKRVERFLKQRFGSTRVKFYDDGANCIVTTRSIGDRDRIIGSPLYVHDGKIKTQATHRQMEDLIKHYAENAVSPPEFSLLDCPATGYANFAI